MASSWQQSGSTLDVDRSTASATSPLRDELVAGPEGSGYMSDDSSTRNLTRGASRKLNKTLNKLNPFKQRAATAGGRWFNPEEFTKQKREWAKQFKDDDKVVGWPSQAFESFIIVGLPPSTDIKSVVAEPEIVQRAKNGDLHVSVTPEVTGQARHRGSRGVPLVPQVLYQYPENKPITPDAAHFCFPHGVQPMLLERTPSMSALNELVYSQQYQHSDANSFVFVLKVADNLPLYGVCCYMDELVHRAPTVLQGSSKLNAPLQRYLVAAPRCYCFLTHYPFFSLHFKVLHMIMGLERLDRIMAFTEEQSGPSGPVDFPPPRHPGRPSTVRGEQGRASGDSQSGLKQNGGTAGSGAREAPAQDTGARAESSAASRDQPASSGGAGPTGDAMSGRERVNAAIASVGSREHAPQQEASPDRRKSLTASLDGEGRVRSLALAWEQARTALQERQYSARNTPQTSPRDQNTSGPPSAAASPQQPDQAPSSGRPRPPISPPGGDSPGRGHARSQSVPDISPCDSAYDAAGMLGRQHEKGGAQNGSGEGPRVSPRSHSEAYASPSKGHVEGSAASDGEIYHRHPPVSSVGLAKLQALLEMQRQRETTRLGNTRELPRRASSTAAVGFPVPTEEEASAAGLANGHMRRQSLSFTGGTSAGTPPRHRPPVDPSTPSPTRGVMPDLARKSARRIQRAQERMQAAVLAAEVELSETFSGRSTEDNEVGIMASNASVASSDDSSVSYRTATSGPLQNASPQHRRNLSGESLGGFSELDTPPRDFMSRLQRQVQGQESLPNSPGSTSTSLPRQESSSQRPPVPESPYATPEGGQGEGPLQQTSVEARSEQPRGGQGGAQGQPLPQSMSAPLGRTVASTSDGPTAGLSGRSRRELRSMSLRPALHSMPTHMPSETASALQVMKAYYATPVPAPGEELEFMPDAELQPVHYARPAILDLTQRFVRRSAIAAAEAEAAEGLRAWTVACLCRSLSLENILTFLTAALLERQMAVFCPNIGVLSASVLSLIPLMRPFAWQSLLLPVLPVQDKMLDLLEAPVPFILGIRYKTAEVAARCKSLMRVNIYKDRLKNAVHLPALPNAASLASALSPPYWALHSIGREAARSRPLYSITDDQKHAAESFLQIVQEHLSGLCANLYQHTITDVQTSERVSLLLKESFVESFPVRDRAFMKQFVETQTFSVYSDSVMK
ncbi:g1428 [Coccomyxa elongata]